MQVAFIGLGIMGSRMAANLLKAGVSVTVYNRSRGPVDQLVAAGAVAAPSAAEAAAHADVVITMLANPQVVEQVMLGEAGALAAMRLNTLWVDCSTVNPAFSSQMASQAQARGLRFLDAPVAGTKPHAENAQLTFFVGGDAGDLASVQPLLEHMGQKVLHIGYTSKGSAFKMLVNAMLAQSMVVFSETLLLGERMGLDKDFLLNTLPNLVVAAPFTKFKAEMIRSGDYEVQFPLELMHKDLHLAALTAYEQGQPSYLVNMAKEIFGSAVQAGYGRHDFAAVHAYLAGQNNA